jgi:hypothetical protein
MTEKETSLNDLKYYYGERHGFIFQGATPSSGDALGRLCNVLIDKKITEAYPEFFTRLNTNTVAIVYPEGISFKCADFYRIGKQTEMMGFFKIDILAAFLKEN